MEIKLNDDIYTQIYSEHSFYLFKSNGLICCVMRLYQYGNLNGYVSVPESHKLYGIDYMSDLYNNIDYIEVHGGITYSENYLRCIDNDVFGKLWWFGFDTAHAWDYIPQYDAPISGYKEYRDFEYVKNECINLAKQLNEYQNQ